MKATDLTNHELLDILQKSRTQGVSYQFKQDYLNELAKVAHEKICVIVFTNALNSIGRTSVRSNDLKEIFPKEYGPMLTDSTCGPILEAVKEVFDSKGYRTAMYVDGRGIGLELVITINEDM